MDDGVTFSISTMALTAIGSGFAGWFASWVSNRKARRDRNPCVDCPEHRDVVSRITELEKNGASQAAYLESIDGRLKSLNELFAQFIMNRSN